MSPKQWREWQAFNQISPIGEYRADLRMGILAQLLANLSRNPEQRRQPYTPKDFMPVFLAEETAAPEPVGAQKAARHQAAMEAMARAYNQSAGVGMRGGG